MFIASSHPSLFGTQVPLQCRLCSSPSPPVTPEAATAKLRSEKRDSRIPQGTNKNIVSLSNELLVIRITTLFHPSNLRSFGVRCQRLPLYHFYFVSS